jgi:carboxylesterase
MNGSVSPHAQPFTGSADPDRTGGRKIGVLLSHGFTGSPFAMMPWARSLHEQGYAVSVPRLPGHGTTWQEMNKTRWDDWYGEIQRALDNLCVENDVVFAAGLSMGGALVLQAAIDRGSDVAGLMLVNPAVSTERKDVIALPVLKYLVRTFPAIGNDIKKPGVQEHSYDKTPLKAAHSMFRGMRQLRAQLGRVTCPVLLFTSREDHVVDGSTARHLRRSLGTPRLVEISLEDSYHVATLDHDAALIERESARFIEQVLRT